MVNFFWLVIRSGSGQNDPNPVRFWFDQNFRSGRTLGLHGLHHNRGIFLESEGFFNKSGQSGHFEKMEVVSI